MRVAFRCDGDERLGAGHVARCLPLADALAQLGWEASFLGAYGGLAARLLERAGAETRAPSTACACGVDAGRYQLVVVDSYEIPPAEICALAEVTAVLTLAEANRCAHRGMLLDYHVDRPYARTATLLAGAAFAPLDPAFAGAARAGERVERVLVALGGSRRGGELGTAVAAMALAAFPDAEVVLAAPAASSSGPAGDRPATGKSETNAADLPRLRELPAEAPLAQAVAEIDLAIVAAGLTAYELVCAGLPQVAIAIAANQRRVIAALRRSKLAPCLDLTAGDSLAQLPALLASLKDAGPRRRMSKRGIRTLDGDGARRAGIALTETFRTSGAGQGHGRREPNG